MRSSASDASAKGDAHPFTAVDLFCGAGGFSLGLTQAGFHVVAAVDSWEVAARTYQANFSHPFHCLDVRAIDGRDLLRSAGSSELDLIVGGPPCQGFSIQRIGADADPRNNLILEFARIVAEARPRLFFMENVPGLLGKRGRQVAEAFVQFVVRHGYQVDWRLVNAAEYGVPQIRKRLLFAGWRSGERPFEFPAVTTLARAYRTVSAAFAGLPELPSDHTAHPNDQLHRRTKLSALNQKRIALIPPGGGMEDLPTELRVNCHKQGAAKIGHRFVYGRLAPDEPAATITARFDSFTRGKFGHPTEPRNITLREGARLQSFPDTFQFMGTQEGIAAQIGNAVPPSLAEVFARSAAVYLAQSMLANRGREPRARAA
jgi:DNA (cytosine-5)-methyltransferase 1